MLVLKLILNVSQFPKMSFEGVVIFRVMGCVCYISQNNYSENGVITIIQINVIPHLTESEGLMKTAVSSERGLQ